MTSQKTTVLSITIRLAETMVCPYNVDIHCVLNHVVAVTWSDPLRFTYIGGIFSVLLRSMLTLIGKVVFLFFTVPLNNTRDLFSIIESVLLDVEGSK